MKKSLLLGLCLLIVPSLIAQSDYYRSDSAYIKFISEAPLETIIAENTDVEGVIDPGTHRVAFTVSISSFQGFNSPLQRVHFKENYMESDIYPNATFSGRIIEEVDFNTEGKYEVRVKGQLSIHGVIKERIILGTIDISENGVVIQTNFTVPLSDHEIVIPKIVHQKIAPNIKVEFFAELQ